MKYQIKIAQKAGFCPGVKNAFLKSYKIAENHKNTCIYGEMVHNNFALIPIYQKGIVLKKTLDEIINDKNIENVIIRAHGIPPNEEELLKNNGKKIFDLTCPKVKKVQLLAKKLSDEGYTVIIFGKENHPEVLGIKGYCNENTVVIKEFDDLKKTNIDINTKLALISQTTMNSIEFNKISDKLKNSYSNISFFNTLCDFPIKIQDNSIEIAKEVDLMIVVGDKKSANTQSLFDKLTSVKKTIFVETENDIIIEEIRSFQKIGLTGGTSTSQLQIDSIKKYLEKNL
ncbi:MAG: 4-hydroxy-3-methylbut-2-enyl diphosphate reductase [Spirochaetes bacterium GWC1_27_15]|nr:MAG: 4-hydroxy-3-methylbut-2-enyl diphosphate reductase [Spirochaetes bacterium GWB1_27_13]OHD21774.1 MAG: 4-hydroxy-3-methylbut-2-enyl diphosphate reductase [Spirochaetes bacterium GWC1_27_15]